MKYVVVWCDICEVIAENTGVLQDVFAIDVCNTLMGRTH